MVGPTQSRQAYPRPPTHLMHRNASLARLARAQLSLVSLHPSSASSVRVRILTRSALLRAAPSILVASASFPIGLTSQLASILLSPSSSALVARGLIPSLRSLVRWFGGARVSLLVRYRYRVVLDADVIHS